MCAGCEHRERSNCIYQKKKNCTTALTIALDDACVAAFSMTSAHALVACGVGVEWCCDSCLSQKRATVCARNFNFLAGSGGLYRAALPRKGSAFCRSLGMRLRDDACEWQTVRHIIGKRAAFARDVFRLFAIGAVDHSNRQGRRKNRRFRREMTSRISDLLSDGVLEI